MLSKKQAIGLNITDSAKSIHLYKTAGNFIPQGYKTINNK